MSAALSYDSFLSRKAQAAEAFGFEPVWMPNFLFDFQMMLTEWSIRCGRSAMFADCGLGKTPMQLVWAENVVRKTNGKVLILTPLAVSAQTVREGEKFGIPCKQSRDGTAYAGITVTNYEQLHRFDPSEFDGVVCDESSAIKAFQGKRRKEVIHFMRKVPYRLMATATAAPNDYIELGTHSEALGILGQMDMLSQFFKSTDDMNHVFFKNGDFWNTHKWMFRAHAETPFWRWVCSWARAIRRPSDLGFDDGAFQLPPLNVKQTVIKGERLLPGELFPKVAVSISEQRDERRLTIKERCEMVVEKVAKHDCSVVWCHMNEEGDLLEKMLPNCRQVQGSDSDEHKEESFLGFSSGEFKTLVTKPKIGAFGLNWQHCAHMTFFPSHSFEQFYQGVRRCWRFGQKRPVTVDVITTEGEAGVTANLQRKAEKADEMFAALVQHMNDSIRLDKSQSFGNAVEVPAWL